MNFLDNSYKVLNKYNVIKKGCFQLSSGLFSEYYIQTMELLKSPNNALRVLEPSIKALPMFDTILCPAIGAIPLAYLVEQMVPWQVEQIVFAEKKDGEFCLRRNFSIEEWEKVLIVEDVITTGNSVEGLMKFSNNIVGVYCMVDRSEGKYLPKVPLFSFCNISFPVYKTKEEFPVDLSKHLIVKTSSTANDGHNG